MRDGRRCGGNSAYIRPGGAHLSGRCLTRNDKSLPHAIGPDYGCSFHQSRLATASAKLRAVGSVAVFVGNVTLIFTKLPAAPVRYRGTSKNRSQC
jgi:hypothetical protein